MEKCPLIKYNEMNDELGRITYKIAECLLPELMDQLELFHPSKLHLNMFLATCQQIPDSIDMKL